ncbi:UNVERIFIED_ORG: hypothetical protein ABRZ91_000142 [Heyndrickxia coagulans]
MASFKKIDKENGIFRFKYWDKISGKQCENKRQGFRTKLEAIHACEEEKRKIDYGYDVLNDELLVEYLAFWLSEYKKDKIAKNAYRLHKRPLLSEHPAERPELQAVSKIHKPSYQKRLQQTDR